MEGKNGTIDKTDKKEIRTDPEKICPDIVVLIGLVIIFKEQLTELVQSILSKIAKQSNSI